MTEEDGRFQFLAEVAAIPDTGLAFSYRSGPSSEGGILVRTAAGVRAWRNLCRHLAVPLDRTEQGRFATRGGVHLVCGEHGALYQPDDGVCVAGPCQGARLRPLTVVVSSGKAFLDTAAIPDPLASGEPRS